MTELKSVPVRKIESKAQETSEGKSNGKHLQPRQHSFPAFVSGSFIRIAYVEWGPPHADQTVLCVHGMSRNSRDFDMLAKKLAAQGVRVVAPDLPGRGKSQWLARAEDYDTGIYVACMSALIARLNVEQLDWVGTSLGGFIGMNIAAAANTPIRRFVINDFGARVPGSALKRIGAYASVVRKFTSLDEINAHLRKVHAPFGPLNDAQWAHIVEHSAVKNEDGSYRLHYDPRIAHQLSWPLMLDLVLWHLWDAVECPVLIMRGSQSDLFRASTAREMLHRGRAAKQGLVELVEFDDCGHAPSLMMEDHMAPALEFLLAEDLADLKADAFEVMG